MAVLFFYHISTFVKYGLIVHLRLKCTDCPIIDYDNLYSLSTTGPLVFGLMPMQLLSTHGVTALQHLCHGTINFLHAFSYTPRG